jgi:hypothetical protein
MPSILTRAVREPLVHFSALAAVLFIATALVRRDDDRIAVSRAELDYRIGQIEARENTTLSPDERQLVEEAYIDERVLIREARAMGLEADERIDDILIQKMLHVLSGDVIQPTDEELAAYYAENQARYAADASVTVDEVVVPQGELLPRALLEGGSPARLPPGTLVGSRVLERMTSDDLAQIFGDQGAATIASAETGDWWEAMRSERGSHWVRIRERFGSVVPPLEVVRDAVRLDWIAQREQGLLLDRVAELRANYSVVVEGR